MRSSVYSRSLKKSDVKKKKKQHEAFKNSLADLAALGGGLSWGGLLETVEERRVPDGLYGLAAGVLSFVWLFCGVLSGGGLLPVVLAGQILTPDRLVPAVVHQGRLRTVGKGLKSSEGCHMTGYFI